MQQISGQEHRVFRLRIDKSGRIVLPAEVRGALGVSKGDAVLVVQDRAGVHLETSEQAVKAIQDYFLKLVPAGVSLADEIIQEHREEAARERE
jgi:AbrB family looped-hinge helix DNA binding protein